MNLEKVDEIIDKYSMKAEYLIQILLDVQQEFNWIPKEAVLRISDKLKVSASQVYRIASFYKAMCLNPIGQHLIQVCLGTACHVRGGPKIIEEVERRLNINIDETTPDMKFTLKRVNCLGCCALGPVMVIDKEYWGKMTSSKVGGILNKYGEEGR